MSVLFKTLKVGQHVRVVSTVKSEAGKTVVSHGCKGFVCGLSGVDHEAVYSVQFPSKRVSLTAFEVKTCIKTLKGRPRKVETLPVLSEVVTDLGSTTELV